MLNSKLQFGLLRTIGTIIIGILLFLLPYAPGLEIYPALMALFILLQFILLVCCLYARKLVAAVGEFDFVFGFYFVWLVILCFFDGSDSNAVKRLLQFVVCYLSFFVGKKCYISNYLICIVKKMILVISVASLICFFLYSAIGESFYFGMANPNIFAIIMFCFLFFLVLYYESGCDIFIGCLLVLCILFSRARSVILVTTFFLLMCCFPSLTEYGRSLFALSVLTAIVVTIGYPQLLGTEIGSVLDGMSQEFFYKSLFTGRQLIWTRFIDLISISPYFGYGIGSLEELLIDYDVSFAHNLYLQLMLQGGVVMLFLLINILWTILCKIRKTDDVWTKKIITAFIVCIVVHEYFETCLVQTISYVGFMMWFMLGLGLNEYNYSK